MGNLQAGVSWPLIPPEKEKTNYCNSEHSAVLQADQSSLTPYVYIFRILDSHIQASCRQVTQQPELNWYFVTNIMLHLKTFGLKSESILFKLKTKKGAIIHQSGTIGLWYCDQMGIYLETPVCPFWSIIFVQGL